MSNLNIERPSLLLAACAPSAFPLPESARVAVLAAERAPASQLHQAQIQAELTALSIDGSNGTTGFSVGGNDTDTAKKYMAKGASGVPPRGRPV